MAVANNASNQNTVVQQRSIIIQAVKNTRVTVPPLPSRWSPTATWPPRYPTSSPTAGVNRRDRFCSSDLSAVCAVRRISSDKIQYPSHVCVCMIEATSKGISRHIIPRIVHYVYTPQQNAFFIPVMWTCGH